MWFIQAITKSIIFLLNRFLTLSIFLIIQKKKKKADIICRWSEFCTLEKESFVSNVQRINTDLYRVNCTTPFLLGKKPFSFKMPVWLFPNMCINIIPLKVKRLLGSFWEHKNNPQANQPTKNNPETITHMFMNHLKHSVHLFYLFHLLTLSKKYTSVGAKMI